MDPPTPLRRNHDFLKLLVAQGLSIAGREVGTLVLPLLVLALTGSALHVGLIAAAQSVPYLIVSLPAGALIDRWDRRRTMLVCEYLRIASLLSVPLVWWADEIHLLHLYAAAVVSGTAFVFYNIAEIAALPQVVSRAQLPRAMSAGNVVEWAGELSGPALGGALVGVARNTVAGAMLAYVVQGVMQLLSVFSLGAIRRPLQAERATGTADLRGEIVAGMRWLLAHPTVRTLAVLAAVLNLLFGPVTIIIVVLARGDYAASPQAVGALFSAAGVVGLTAAVAAPWLQQLFRVGHVIVAAVVGWSLGMAMMALSGSIYGLAVGWATVTAVGGVYDVVATSHRLALIPEAMQGRVNSVFRFIGFGVRPVTLAAGGAMIASLGARHTLWLLATGMTVAALVTASSSLRKTAAG